MRRKRDNDFAFGKKPGIGFSIAWVTWILISLACWAAVISVAYHFITKWW